MGITGLLPFLEKASRRCNVAEFRGCTVAIDAYCWLHKGAFGCAEKLVRGEDTNSYVLYCLKYIKMLQSFDIRPILVFDGQHLPAKKQTEEKRRELRDSSRRKVTEFLRIGKIEEARMCMKSCINITHTMALSLIKECRDNGVDCIVAPYEADAQLAYLSIKKYVDLVITEDSDLLLFGCDKVLFKMDIQGSGTLVEASKINLCMKLRHDHYSFSKFRYMCILSGCDYIESLPGVGIKKALKFISLTANPSIYNVLVKLPSYLKLSNIVVTDDYRERFMLADATFQHQLVFDPLKRELVPLHNLETAGTNERYCKNAGNVFDGELAFQMAIGNMDPFTHKRYDNWTPDEASLPHTSIWSTQYHKCSPPNKKLPKTNITKTENVGIELKVKLEEQLDYDTKLETELKLYEVLNSDMKKRKITSKPNIAKPVLAEGMNILFKKLKKLSRTELVELDSIESRPSSVGTINNDANSKENDRETIQEINKYGLEERCMNKKEVKIGMPFKKLKKLSKFERTVINYEELTTSSFFARKKVTESVPSNPGGNYESLLSSISDYTKNKSILEGNMNDTRSNKDLTVTEIDEHELKRRTNEADDINIPLKKCRYQISEFEDGDCEEGTSRCFNKKNISDTNISERANGNGSCNSDVIEESPVETEEEKSLKRFSKFTITKKKCLNKLKDEKVVTMDALDFEMRFREMKNDKTVFNLVEETSRKVMENTPTRSSLMIPEVISIHPVENDKAAVIIDEKIIQDDVSLDMLADRKEHEVPSCNAEKETKNKTLSPIISGNRTSFCKKAVGNSRKKLVPSGRQMDLRSMFSNMKKA